MSRPAFVAWWVLCLFVVSAALAPAAQAHAGLVASDPAEGAVLADSPETVSLTFTEPVSLSDASTQLYDATGSEVDSEPQAVDEVVTVTPDGELADGSYVLTYRVISSDGHPIAGSLTFSVGAPSPTVVAPDELTSASDPAVTAVHGIVQGLSYLALFLAAGLAVFLVLLLPAALTDTGVRRRLTRLMRVAAGVATTGFLLLVPIGTTYQQGTGLDGLTSAATWRLESMDGIVFLLVLFGLGVTVGLLGDDAPAASDRLVVPAIVAAALASVALVGHTRGYGPPVLVVTADVLHVLAGAVWFGGLVGLAFTLPALAGHERLAAVTLARFSTLAGALLALVAVTGVLLGWRILGSWEGLVTRPYGVLLLVKVTVIAAVVGIAGWNRYRLLPAMGADHRPSREAAGRLRAAVRLEVVGLVGVLLLTGFLVNQLPGEPTPTAPPAQAETFTAEDDDVRVAGRLDPGTTGTNTLTVELEDPAGGPLRPLDPPTVSIQSDGIDLGSRPLRRTGPGTFRTEVVIPEPGSWEFRVSVRVDRFTNPVLTVPVEVGD